MDNADMLNSHIIYDRDYTYNYFGFKVRRRIFCGLHLHHHCNNYLPFVFIIDDYLSLVQHQITLLELRSR